MIVHNSGGAWLEAFEALGTSLPPSRTATFTFEWDGETLLANGVILGKRDDCGLLRVQTVQTRDVPALNLKPKSRFVPPCPSRLLNSTRVVCTGDVFVPLSVSGQREEWLQVWRRKIKSASFHYKWAGRGVKWLSHLTESQHARLCGAMSRPYTTLTPWKEVLVARAALSLKGKLLEGGGLSPLPEDLV